MSTILRLITYGLILLLCQGETALGQEFSLEKVDIQETSIGKTLKSILNPHGFRILNEQGKSWCEVWSRQEITSTQEPASPDAQYPSFYSGLLLGLMRFPADGSDYRGLPIKKGMYTMRYGVIPQDGNHVGASPIVDFVLLIPMNQDGHPPDAHLSSQDLVELSRKASGTNHPTVINLAFPPDSLNKAILEEDDLHHWVLSLPVTVKSKPSSEMILSIIVYGQATG